MIKKMSFAWLFSLALSGVHAQNNTPPTPVYPLPTQKQLDWHKLETYAFIHFGLNTFNDLEWGYGDTPASTFAPRELDCDQWVQIIKSVGMKGVMLTAKHHDGFCLWPSKYTEYSVKNAPWKEGKGDLVKDLSEACRRHGLKFGIYLSPWDRNHAAYGQAEYVTYFHNQMEELLTNYGDLFEYWFDGANGGDGWYGGANEKRAIDAKTYYRYEDARKTINKLQPDAVIFGGTCADIRWIGNEEGFAGMTNWSAVKGAGDEFVNDFTQGEADGDNWLPGEADVSIRPGWFYHAREDHQVHSLSHLVDIYYESVGRNANLLLNFPIDLNGKIHPLDSVRIMEWKAVLDADFKTNLLTQATVTASQTRGADFAAKNVLDGSWDSYWAAPDGATMPMLTFTFPTEETVNRILLQEYIPLGQRVSKFTVEWLDKGTWKPIETTEESTTIGYKRIIRFQNVHTTSVRVTFAEAKGPVCINNVEMFHAPALLVEPVINRDANGLVTLTAGSENASLLYSIDAEKPAIPYTAPFVLDKKGTVRALAVDAETQKQSAIALRSFDIPACQMTIGGVVAKDAKWAFDDNSTTAVATIQGENQIVLTLQSEKEICGLKYTPDAGRWGGGYISRYQVRVDGVLVAEGEFSNIQNNPIEQVLTFPAVKGKVVTLKGTAILQGEVARVSEISLLTK